MYIKNNEQTYNCCLSDRDNPVAQVSFILDKKPNLQGEKIEVFSSEKVVGIEDKLLFTINRNNYEREEITELDNGKCILLLSNKKKKEVSKENEINFLREKTKKLTQLSNYTSQSITDGIEYKNERFSFEAHDQQNLIAICQYLSDNEDIEGYLYHANGAEFKEYNRIDLFELRKLMIEHITEYQKNHNIKKQLINQTSNLEELKQISIEKE